MAQYTFTNTKGEIIVIYDKVNDDHFYGIGSINYYLDHDKNKNIGNINLGEMLISTVGKSISQYQTIDPNVKEMHFEMKFIADDDSYWDTEDFKISHSYPENPIDYNSITRSDDQVTLKLDYNFDKNGIDKEGIFNILKNYSLKFTTKESCKDLGLAHNYDYPVQTRYTDAQVGKAIVVCDVLDTGISPKSVGLANCSLDTNGIEYEKLHWLVVQSTHAKPSLSIQTSLQIIGQNDNELDNITTDILLYTCSEQLQGSELIYELL